MATSSNLNRKESGSESANQLAQQAHIASSYIQQFFGINKNNQFADDMIEKQKNLLIHQNLEKQRYITDSGNAIKSYGFTIDVPSLSSDQLHQTSPVTHQNLHLNGNTTFNMQWNQIIANYLEDKSETCSLNIEQFLETKVINDFVAETKNSMQFKLTNQLSNNALIKSPSILNACKYCKSKRITKIMCI